MIETILAVAIASLVIGTIVYVAVLLLKSLVKWIRARGEIAKKNEVGFILKEKMNSGKYKVINGVFNTQKQNIEEFEARETRTIDSEFQELEDLTIYS